MSGGDSGFGRSIRLFLADGTPSGVITAQMAGWTGKLIVGRNANLPILLARHEVKQPGVYVLQGTDPEVPGAMRVYIGEGEVVSDRLDRHAKEKDFWDTACVITVTDESLTKGHVQYLESRLIEMASNTKRAHLDNGTSPSPTKKPLPEADRSDMEYFLHYLKIVLPVVGFDFLKPVPNAARRQAADVAPALPAQDAVEMGLPIFEIRHKKTGIVARAMEIDGEFVVLEGSEAIRDAEFTYNAYANKRAQLIDDGTLNEDDQKGVYVFVRDYPFSKPSAASSVVLNRNSNGRTEWKLAATGMTYNDWQEERRRQLEGGDTQE